MTSNQSFRRNILLYITGHLKGIFVFVDVLDLSSEGADIEEESRNGRTLVK